MHLLGLSQVHDGVTPMTASDNSLGFPHGPDVELDAYVVAALVALPGDSHFHEPARFDKRSLHRGQTSTSRKYDNRVSATSCQPDAG